MLKIVIKNDYYYANETTDCTFYIKYNGMCFPSDEWTDFPIDVLEMWISNILIYKKKNKRFTLFFLDGPYFIECFVRYNQIKMKFIENRGMGKTRYKCSICINDFIKEVYAVSMDFVSDVEKNHFGRLRGLENLKILLKSLEIL